MHTILTAQSDYSPGYSILKIRDIVSEAKRLGQSVVGLTDIMSVNGLIELTQECNKVGIKPIIGALLRITTDITWRKTKGGPKRPPDYYLRWYVAKESGLKQLYKLLTLAHSEDRFYQQSQLTLDDVCEALEKSEPGSVVVTTGGLLGLLNYRGADQVIERLDRYKKTVKFYFELCPINTPLFDTINTHALSLNAKYSLGLLYTYPTLYLRGQDEAQEVMMSIVRNTKIASLFHYKNAVRDFYPLEIDEYEEKISNLYARLLQRRVSAKLFPDETYNPVETSFDCNIQYHWERPENSLPVMSGALSSDDELEEWCLNSFNKRLVEQLVFGYKPSEADIENIYRPRLKYELQTIKECGFADYFLLVGQLVHDAKKARIRVGCGRGSVGGSLVAYLLGITETDPVRFNLLFERFINKERLDLPDIDLDFMSARRHEVYELLEKRHGKDRVVRISNYNTLQSAGALRDVGKCFGLNESDYACSKLVPKKHGVSASLEDAAKAVPEIDRFRRAHPKIWEITNTLSDRIKVMGKHAAGVVVGGCDIIERGNMERRSGEIVINWDKNLAEQQGLVKIDVLGLETLDLIELALSYIRKRHSSVPDIFTISLDDRKVLDNFAQGKTVGIFQLESVGMRKLLRSLGENGNLTFHDVVAATALFRPGPLDSGMMDSYVRCKSGKEEVIYAVPQMEHALKSTYGQIVYQEQVMQLARDLAGFTFSEADTARKSMGKKDINLLNKLKDKFVDGCVQHSQMDRELAVELFQDIAAFAGYGFNFSHATSYTLLSLQAMWLKTYYTVEFYAAAFSLLGVDKLLELVKDAEEFGIEVLPPDINQSTDEFEILTDTKLLIPFNRIKGVGPSATAAILKARSDGPFTSKDDFVSRVSKRCHTGHLKLLQRVGAFRSIDVPYDTETVCTRLKDQQELLENLMLHIVPVHKTINKKTIKEQLVPILQSHSGLIAREYNDRLVMPTLGSTPSFMAILDCPSKQDAKTGHLLRKGGDYIQRALNEHDMSIGNAYWTALIKTTKSGSTISSGDFERDVPILEQEINIVNPPLIVLLGTAVLRYFIPSLKGRASDVAGQIVYDSKRDVNFLCGFNPMEIYFDNEKQELLNSVFSRVSLILDN